MNIKFFIHRNDMVKIKKVNINIFFSYLSNENWLTYFDKFSTILQISKKWARLFKQKTMPQHINSIF